MKRMKLLRRGETDEAAQAAFYMQLVIFAVALLALVLLATYLPETAPAALPTSSGLGG